MVWFADRPSRRALLKAAIAAGLGAAAVSLGTPPAPAQALERSRSSAITRRFDNDAGLSLGQRIAKLTLRRLGS
jgi:hypothetical protein